MESIIKFWKKQQNHLWKSTRHLLNKNGTENPFLHKETSASYQAAPSPWWPGMCCTGNTKDRQQPKTGRRWKLYSFFGGVFPFKSKFFKFRFSIFTFYPPTFSKKNRNCKTLIIMNGPLVISPIQLLISTIHLVISPIQRIVVSLIELEISLLELEISLIELQISLIELEISLNELVISTIQLQISPFSLLLLIYLQFI